MRQKFVAQLLCQALGRGLMASPYRAKACDMRTVRVTFSLHRDFTGVRKLLFGPEMAAPPKLPGVNYPCHLELRYPYPS